MARRLSHSKDAPKNLFGPTLKALRLRAGLTQADLARKLQLDRWDVDEVVISYIENSRRMITDIELCLFLSALGAKLSDLEGTFQKRKGTVS